MYQLSVSNLTEERQEDFVFWSEDELLIPMSNWNIDEDDVYYIDLNESFDYIGQMTNIIKKDFPETTIKVFKYELNKKPLVVI